MLSFKTFLLEGGAALKTSPISQADARDCIPKIIKQLTAKFKLNPSDIKLIGSASKKPNDDDMSGDIDFAIKVESQIAEKALPELAYDNKTFKIMKGINVYSYGFDIGNGKIVQVDLMPVNNPKFVEWSSQANKKDLEQGLKGSHRNELFFAVVKHANPKTVKYDKDNNPLVIDRHFYDLQRGLMVGTKTRESKKISKNFKTIDKKVLTDDPNKITKFLFGDHVTSADVSTFKDTLAAIKSPKFPYKSKYEDIIKTAKSGIISKGLKVPDYI